MIATEFKIKRLTWDCFERACLILGIDAEALFFGATIGEVPDQSLTDGAALVALLSREVLDTGAMTPADLAECAIDAVRGLLGAVSEAQAEAHRYRNALDVRYPRLFKQKQEDSGPPMRIMLSRFGPMDYAEITQRWSLTEIYLWLLALKVNQFDDMVRDSIADFRKMHWNQ